MKRALLMIGLLMSLAAIGNSFELTGSSLALTFVYDDRMSFFFISSDLGFLNLDPRGLSDPPSSVVTRTMTFPSPGILTFSQRSGRIRRYDYQAVPENRFQIGDFTVRNNDGRWYQAVDEDGPLEYSDGHEIYFCLYFDGKGIPHVHIIQLIVGDDLATTLYRVNGITEL